MAMPTKRISTIAVITNSQAPALCESGDVARQRARQQHC